MHDLSGSWLRHARAQEHMADVKRLAKTIRNEGKIVLPAESELDAGQDTIKLPPADTPADDLAIRVGETTYNLRAALDYAVHSISGERKSQFPLDNSKEHFHARKTGRLPNRKRFPAYLRGVPPRECDLIDAVQPYKGIDWSRRLSRLTNRDKHRDFIVVNAISGQPFTRKEIGALYPSDNLYPSDSLFPSSGHVEMHSEPTFDIALDDGALLTEALQELETEVRALLTRLEGP